MKRSIKKVVKENIEALENLKTHLIKDGADESEIISTDEKIDILEDILRTSSNRVIDVISNRDLVKLVLVSCGVVLGLAGVSGWGWLVFLAVCFD